jgi:CrcB protein
VSARPYLRPTFVLAVAAGGMVGTLARATLTGAEGQVGGWPVGTLTENVVGSFLLGLLLEALLRRATESRRTRVVRLGLGTGMLGGFTTFSSLALELERLLAGGSWGIAAGYATATLVLGLSACLGGVALGARLASGHRGRPAAPTGMTSGPATGMAHDPAPDATRGPGEAVG